MNISPVVCVLRNKIQVHIPAKNYAMNISRINNYTYSGLMTSAQTNQSPQS